MSVVTPSSTTSGDTPRPTMMNQSGEIFVPIEGADVDDLLRAIAERDSQVMPSEAPAPYAHVVHFEKTITLGDPVALAAKISALQHKYRIPAMKKGICAGAPSQDPKTVLSRHRGAFALDAAPLIRDVLIDLMRDPSLSARAQFSSLARTWAMMYCPKAAYRKRGCLIVYPFTVHGSESDLAARECMMIEAGLRVEFYTTKECLEFEDWAPAKTQRRFRQMVRDYNPEHCFVVAVQHPGEAIGTFDPAYQFRWHNGQVSQDDLQSDAARLLLHACDGDLTCETPHPRDSASFARFRKKFRHWNHRSLHGVGAVTCPARCSRCAKEVKNAPVCSRCRTKYCSAECQKADWPAHKSMCEKLVKEQAEFFDEALRIRDLVLGAGSSGGGAGAGGVGGAEAN